MQPDELKAIRSAAGMTQQAFAEAMGMSRKAINEMESGKAPIEARTAILAQYMRPREDVLLIGGKAAGQWWSIVKGDDQITVPLPRWMPPFVAPGSPGVSCPRIPYQRVRLPDGAPFASVFVPGDEPGWDGDRALAELRAMPASDE